MSFTGVREERFKTPLVPVSPPRYGVSPQHGQSTLAFEQHTSLDATFNKLVFEIMQRLNLYAKGPKIRLETWLRKLHEPVRYIVCVRATIPPAAAATASADVATRRT